MLEEFWHWLRIDASGLARELGFRREAAALRARHRRCATAWRPHLEATRRCLLRSARLGASANPSRDRAVLLGAGLLRDVPLSELLALYREVVLADIAFHPEARAAQRDSAGRVQLVSIDMSSSLEALVAQPNCVPVPEHRNDSPLRALCGDAEWVASVNLLTQLPLLPCAWMRRHGQDEDRIETFANAVMHQHLQLLTHLPGTVCIVTEREDQVLDGQGEVVERVSRSKLLADHLATPPWRSLENWTWQVNPRGELPADHTEARLMLALHRDPLRPGHTAGDPEVCCAAPM